MLKWAQMTGSLFAVPISYIALTVPGPSVFTRVGSGGEHWRNLSTYPLASVLESPLVIRDCSGGGLPAGTTFGDIQFAATAPLKTLDGMSLGFLVVADVKPHPEFSQTDIETLNELARTLASNMELYLLADIVRMAAQTQRNLGGPLDNIPIPALSIAQDGQCQGVNEAWQTHTGVSFPEACFDGWLECVGPESRAEFEVLQRTALAKEIPLRARIQLKERGGRFREMKVNGNLFRTASGSPHYILVFSDPE